MGNDIGSGPAISVLYVDFLPLRQKLLKTLQNEAIVPLITKNTLIHQTS